MDEPLLISFYTKETIYEKEIEDLIASCQALGVASYIEARQDQGSWDRNCCQKPLFILECLEKFSTPLLWVDADAIVLKKPSLILEDIDIALYFNDLSSKQARSATIYIAPTPVARAFVKQWHQACLTELAKGLPIPYGDQSILISLLHEFSLRIGNLPLGYTAIFDRDFLPIEQTTILHFQASRTALMAETLWQNLSGSQLKALRITSSH